jgi:ribosome-associated protein
VSKEVTINSEYITLGQFLKLADIIDSGGMAKWFLQEFHITVNGEDENRRGKKLRHGDVVFIKSKGSFTVVNKEQ